MWDVRWESNARTEFMRGKGLLLTCILIAIINVAWIWRFRKNAGEYQERELRTKETQYRLSRENQQLRSALACSARVDYTQLPVQMKVIAKGHSPRKLADLIGESEKLILYLTDNHCSSCIDEVLFFLKRRAEQFSLGDILIIYRRIDSMEARWEHRSKIIPGISFLEIEKGEPDLQLDHTDYPCFFITGPGMSTGKSFVFLPLEEKENDKYLKLIAERFRKSKNHEIT